MSQNRILHIMNGAVAGGISMTVLNMYIPLNHSRFHFDCAVYDTNLGQNGIKLKEMGVEFFRLPLKSHRPISYAIKLARVLKNGNYDTVHVHLNWGSHYPLLIAELCGIENRIAHAHANYLPSGLLGRIKAKISQMLIRSFATKLVACSNSASEAIFGISSENGRVVILKNSIDVNQFRYDESIRQKKREEIGIEPKIVIGCVGNLGKEKNTGFAIDILKRLPEAYSLVIIGEGPEKNNLQIQAKMLEVDKRVLFLGRRDDVNDWLQAFDIFIMPSLHEGFGIAALEAASAGLPIFLSNEMPKDFKFYSKCKYLKLDNYDEWVYSIISYTISENRKLGADEVKNAGYDIVSNKEHIETIYAGNEL